MTNPLFHAIRSLADDGYGVDDILAKLNLAHGRHTRAMVWRIAFEPGSHPFAKQAGCRRRR